jgi:hypothetical protein
MKSTFSELKALKIAKFRRGWFTTNFTDSEVRVHHGCLVDLMERNECRTQRASWRTRSVASCVGAAATKCRKF